ncbi:NADH-quinone oxidoreductase subunit NuoF [Sodalis-like secondary symbiont of Drepanosiphum platanoidis]|uniref:NADH-quinone oxidoreductase subunit NuoF n=1 Tax=Sodalis-like secondary symbiont of Drepanosiphum platanoidis TaxID=2994493 RepID=UPI003463C69F
MIKRLLRFQETHPLTWRMRNDNKTVWIKEYIKKNGYKGAFNAISKMSKNSIINLVKDSKLKGRGGAGFFTGIKWELISKNTKNNKSYLICNADEMEPGTYKDRFLMERLPHLLIEGILIASFAINSTRSYIFIRGEYINAIKYIFRAINEAKNFNFLGKNIFNSGFNLEIVIHSGAGRYICGEETALINSLEGKRANPRSKPPFPASVGLWGKPTCVNNVETLCNLPALLEHGLKFYKNLNKKKSKDTGTKLMGFSGKVKYPGIWEFPFGITSREIFEDYAGGMINGLSLKAWQPGGASTAFLTKNHLDVIMDFESISKVGSRLGTAISMAIDSNTSIISVVLNIEKFFSRESCGFCTPCREGLPWIVKILYDLEKKEGYKEDIKTLKDLCFSLSPGKTFCAHAPGASEPLKSSMNYFIDEFKNGIKKSKIFNIDKIIGIQKNI